jgi:hypothetical protein
VFVLGHVGPTVMLARAADRDVDLRWAALLAVGPDLLDKPAALLFPSLVNENTRALGHSAAGALVVLAVLLLLGERVRRPLILWACYVGHFVLDRMWLGDNPGVLFWPLLGPFPPPVRGAMNSRLFMWNVYGEAFGAALLLGFALRHRLFDRERLLAAARGGRVP